jgi:hypothetical protein
MAAYQFRSAADGFKGATLLGDGRGPVPEHGEDVGGLLVVRLQVRF